MKDKPIYNKEIRAMSNNTKVMDDTTKEAKKQFQIQIRKLEKLETTAHRSNDR